MLGSGAEWPQAKKSRTTTRGCARKEKVRIEYEQNERMGTGAETDVVEDCFIACDDEQTRRKK